MRATVLLNSRTVVASSVPTNMVSFQLRSLPGTAWPAVPTPETSQLWAAYLELNRTQWLPPAELEERQLQQLRVLLLHCFHEVAYYRRILTEIGYPKRPIKSLDGFPPAAAPDARALSREQSRPPGEEPAAGHDARRRRVHVGDQRHADQGAEDEPRGLWWNALYLRDLEWSRSIPPDGWR